MADDGLRPAAGETALLIIDMINDLDFEQAGEPGDPGCLKAGALNAARAIAKLRDECDAAGVPVIYVNDNMDEWHSERSRLVERCLESDNAEMVRLIEPRPDDIFVIKPQFSGFYATNLPVLLPRLGVTRLILTGVAADICILFTAADAHMRQYELWVPEDCTAANSAERTEWALDIMRCAMNADTRGTGELSVREWVGRDK